MFQDVRYALRLWASRPWETGFAIAALAVGIGASTGVFSVVNALLLRSLPFREPDRLALVHSYEFIPPHDNAKEFHDWRQHSDYLADAALFEEFDVNLAGAGAPSRAHTAQTSGNFFSVLGTQPVLGRAFAQRMMWTGRERACPDATRLR
jgi:putative ABC transport system permease protein